MIEWYTEVIYECDGVGCNAPRLVNECNPQSYSEDAAIKYAESKGWSVAGSHAYCPQHNEVANGG